MADTQPVWVAFGTAAVALAGVVYTAIWNARSQSKLKRTDAELARLNASLQEEREAKAERRDAAKIIATFSNPLMHAAYDLQSRIFNILCRNFLTRYLLHGSAHEQEYAVENTVFLVAQVLGWTELIRQEIQFLPLQDDAQRKLFRSLQDKIYSQLQTDKLGSGLRLFAGEQRAVGELMIDRSGDTFKCLGYAGFLAKRDRAIDHWLDPLREDVRQMARDSSAFEKRLIPLQHSLIDLLDYLDPQQIWFPGSSRKKISSTSACA